MNPVLNTPVDPDLPPLGSTNSIPGKPIPGQPERTRRTYPTECLHHLFETQAQRTPDQIALCSQGERQTYGELNARANQIAWLLRGFGAVPGRFVAIWAERSCDIVAAMLGVLKSGAAYIPLDPAFPADRVRSILDDSGARIVLTTAKRRSQIADYGGQVVVLAEYANALAAAPPMPLDPHDDPPKPGDLCYVIFTSGSTGRPKGVMIEHRSVCNFVRAESELLGIQSSDRVLHQASLAFDVSVEEIWLTFYAGATLVLAPEDFIGGQTQPSDLLRAEQITVLSCVPTLLSLLDENIPSLRLLLVGGESCPAAVVSRWATTGRRVFNGYGPTETTVVATMGELRPECPVTIGRPLANYSVYILDEKLRPVERGVPGELHVGGVSLARGYLGLPELTDKRFIANPFCDPSGDDSPRLYRTGDLVRLTAQGEIEYLGRTDAQIKINGYRVEPAEIESALSSHAQVREAAVVVRQEDEVRRLIAFVVAQAETPSSDVLRRHLLARLPHWMVPFRFIPLEQLPRMVSGKIDRSALENLATKVILPMSAYAAPMAEVEMRLARLWEEVLQRDRVGLDDDFFELGGHSLLAMRLFTRIEQEFGRALPLSSLFHGATVRHLAELLNQQGDVEPDDWLVPIQPRGTRRPLFMLPSLTGDLLLWRDLVRLLGPDQPCWGLHPRLKDGTLQPFTSFEDMGRTYAAAVRQVQSRGPYQLIGSSFGGELAYELACRLHEQGESVSLLAIFDASMARHQPPLRFPILHGVGCSLKNLPYWMWYDFLGTPWRETLGRTTRKVHSLAWRVARRLGLVAPDGDDPDDTWDPTMPLYSREIFQGFDQAWCDYQPRQYPGRMLLFRAWSQPFWHYRADKDLGWGRLAATVDVLHVPGNHESILHEPHLHPVYQRLLTELAG